MADKKYPVDEFDRLASDRKVRGAHRRQESNRKWWIALVAILVCAPLLGWGIVHWAGQKAGPAGGEPTAEVTQTPSAEETTPPASDEATESATPSEEPSEEPTEEETEEPAGDPILSTPVQVRNASDIPGYAASMQQKLYDAGYTEVGADNYPSMAPDVTQVFYPDESFKDTALNVAETLGAPADADHVIEGEGTEGTGMIVVVLGGELP